MTKCLYFYSKILGFFITILGFSILLVTNGSVFAKHMVCVGAILIGFAYIIKLFILPERIYDWWKAFPELNANEMILRRERAYNHFMFFYYLTLFLSLIGIAIYLVYDYYFGLWVSGIFACCALLLYFLELWHFHLKLTIVWDWSLVFPQLCGMYTDNNISSLNNHSKKVTEEEVVALRTVYLELFELKESLQEFKLQITKRPK